MGGEEDRGKGKLEELKGRGKQVWGSVTDDQSTQAEGKGEELKGKVRQKLGDVKDKLDRDKDRA